MLSSDDPLEKAGQFVKQGVGFAKTLGRRIIVHALSFVAAILLANSPLAKLSEISGTSGYAAAIFCVYIGLICLVPRMARPAFRWWFPVGAGLLTAAVALAFGVPVQYALLLGGFQTWLQKLIAGPKRGGWDWAASPWLLIGLWNAFFFHDNPVTGLAWIGGVGLVALLGAMGQRIWGALRLDPDFRTRMKTGLETIRDFRVRNRFPGQLAAPLAQLERQSALLLESPKKADKLDLAMAEGLERLVGQLDSKLPEAAILDFKPDLMRQASLAMEDMSRRIEERIKERRGQRETNVEESKTARKLSALADSADKLALKGGALPAEMASKLDSICKNAHAILDAMRKDPGDLAPGERFLNRYLPATHKIADEYLAIGRTAAPDVIQRGVDLLTRLDAAFRDQLQRFIDNDVLNFNVEINVLDKLLKMDGH